MANKIDLRKCGESKNEKQLLGFHPSSRCLFCRLLFLRETATNPPASQTPTAPPRMAFDRHDMFKLQKHT